MSKDSFMLLLRPNSSKYDLKTISDPYTVSAAYISPRPIEDKGQGRTPRDTYYQLSQRCGGARVDVKDESKNTFRRMECFVGGMSDIKVRTIKDRRNLALITEDLKSIPPDEPLIYVSITSGNSGYSLGCIAREIMLEKERDIAVVNIVPKGISRDILMALESCSVVVERDLTKKITFSEMREIAREATGFTGSYENIRPVERIGLENGYRRIVGEIKEQGDPPTYIFCPAGEGELLVEIAEAAKIEFPENTPKVIGVTGHNNILAHFEMKEEDGFIVIENEREDPDDKLASGYSKLLGQIRELESEGRVGIVAVDNLQIARGWNDILGLGIDSEPSAAVAFAGAFAYAPKLKPSDRIVIINSGRGIFDEGNAKRFLEKDYKKDQIDSEGKNGLMRAIDRDDRETIWVLLEDYQRDLERAWQYTREHTKERMERKEWAKKDFCGVADDMPLSHVAERHLYMDKGQLFLQDKKGESPLIQAIKLGGWETPNTIFSLLRQNSKILGEWSLSESPLRNNLALRDNNGMNALNHAILKKRYRLAAKMVEHASWDTINNVDNDGFSVIQYACMAGDSRVEPVITKLIEKGALVGGHINFYAYPAALAAEWASIETIRLLVEKAEQEYGEKLAPLERLREAIGAGDVEKAAELTREGANLNEWITCANDRYMHIAIANWKEVDLQKLERLIEAGVSVERPDERGRTPIEEAIYFSEPDAVRFLLRHGAKHPELSAEEAIARAEKTKQSWESVVNAKPSEVEMQRKLQAESEEAARREAEREKEREKIWNKLELFTKEELEEIGKDED